MARFDPDKKVSNLRAREAMERAQLMFREHPLAPKKENPPTTAVWSGGLQCQLEHPEGHLVVTDMTTVLGGAASGPSPGWLLRAALASCTATAIAMRAALQGIELRGLEVSVNGDVDIRAAVGIEDVSLAMSGIRMTIKIRSENAPEDRLREIAQWGATQSTVSATLRERSSVAVEVSVV